MSNEDLVVRRGESAEIGRGFASLPCALVPPPLSFLSTEVGIRKVNALQQISVKNFAWRGSFSSTSLSVGSTGSLSTLSPHHFINPTSFLAKQVERPEPDSEQRVFLTRSDPTW